MPVLHLGDALLVGLPIILSASTLLWMHWYPWNKGAKPLGYLARYVLGTVCLVGIPIITFLVADALSMQRGLRWVALFLALNAVISGIAVRIAYWIDDNRAVTLEEYKRHAGLR